MKKYNFNAGPSILPKQAIDNTAKAVHRKDIQSFSSEAVQVCSSAWYLTTSSKRRLPI